jgi:hypothetical protein
VKLTKSRMKKNIEKARKVEGKKENREKESNKENSREIWWMIKEQTRQPNL